VNERQGQAHGQSTCKPWVGHHGRVAGMANKLAQNGMGQRDVGFQRRQRSGRLPLSHICLDDEYTRISIPRSLKFEHRL
jgi:hypothetical protein